MGKSQGSVLAIKNEPKKATQESERVGLWHLGIFLTARLWTRRRQGGSRPPRGAGDTSQPWKSGRNFPGKSCKSEHGRTETQKKHDPHPDHGPSKNSAQPGHHDGLGHAAETRRDRSRDRAANTGQGSQPLPRAPKVRFVLGGHTTEPRVRTRKINTQNTSGSAPHYHPTCDVCF